VERAHRIEVAWVVCACGGDWRDEMQVKHDAKTIQELEQRHQVPPWYNTVQHRTVKDDIS
jgi:hypothetical protein